MIGAGWIDDGGAGKGEDLGGGTGELSSRMTTSSSSASSGPLACERIERAGEG